MAYRRPENLCLIRALRMRENVMKYIVLKREKQDTKLHTQCEYYYIKFYIKAGGSTKILTEMGSQDNDFYFFPIPLAFSKLPFINI